MSLATRERRLERRNRPRLELRAVVARARLLGDRADDVNVANAIHTGELPAATEKDDVRERFLTRDHAERHADARAVDGGRRRRVS
jgi:hypothetical protein